MTLPQRTDGSYAAVHSCLACGRNYESLSGVAGAENLDPQSVVVCLYCGYPGIVVAVTADGVELREPTHPEWMEMLSDAHMLTLWFHRAHGMGAGRIDPVGATE